MAPNLAALKTAARAAIVIPAVFALGSVWIGLSLSYLFPTLPPSSMIIGAAVAVYTLTLCIAAARDPQAIRQRLTGPPLHHAHEH